MKARDSLNNDFPTVFKIKNINEINNEKISIDVILSGGETGKAVRVSESLEEEGAIKFLVSSENVIVP